MKNRICRIVALLSLFALLLSIPTLAMAATLSHQYDEVEGYYSSSLVKVKKGKKVIAVPRLAKYGEHVDDHQIQLIGQFRNLNLIYACMDCDLQKALDVVKNTTYNEYKSNTDKIIKSLEVFIEK